MNRVYLLLRDNSQTGPYTFDELLQQQLQSSDLIWVEGKSVAWTYPYEIEDLRKSFNGPTVEPLSISVIKPIAASIDKPEIKNEIPELPADKPAMIPVLPPKKPKDEIEKRAEELRKKALAFAHQANHTHVPSLHITDDFRPHLSEKDAVHFVNHNTRQSAPVGEILVAAMMLGLIVLGWYGGANKYFVNSKKSIPNTVATQLVASDMHAAASNATAQPTTTNPDSTSRTDSAAIYNTANYTVSNSVSYAGKKPATPVTDSPDIEEYKPEGNEVAAAVQNNNESNKNLIPEKKQDPADTKESDNKNITEKKSDTEKKDADIKNESSQSNKESDTKPDGDKAEEEKKKSIGDVFKGIFKKKKKD